MGGPVPFNASCGLLGLDWGWGWWRSLGGWVSGWVGRKTPIFGVLSAVLLFSSIKKTKHKNIVYSETYARLQEYRKHLSLVTFPLKEYEYLEQSRRKKIYIHIYIRLKVQLIVRAPD